MLSPLPFHLFAYGPLTDDFFLKYSDQRYMPEEIELNRSTIHDCRTKMRKKYFVLDSRERQQRLWMGFPSNEGKGIEVDDEVDGETSRTCGLYD
jgi:hypothetical protein